ncbi:cobalt-precorrin-6A reductase [Pseudoruegeria sp. SHC-113]|uniref:cobalt-precorrin-6A reductase n=1 Tax=Pseudoruegeria sp. SHC-113 TaxID=2855439 RepID=UPI0021BB52B6|nr:cobalt-precorrin-6A reductase [Pseudoruegeria sp. SHC-113]MCT8160585.1 cobalt-precorrin-6A reductase [Pseudoruegeria sp. SHC-113]
MKLLLLAGTGEARRLAQALAQVPGLEVTASLSGATRAPMALPVPTRSGGFGGEEAQKDYMQSNGIEAVVDATHPFAHRISARTAALCSELGLPYVQLLRPAWQPELGDTWVQVASGQDAPAHIPPGARVFLAVGRQTLTEFESLTQCHLICRQIDPPDAPFPFPNGEFRVGRPPFSIEDEEALFRKLRIDWLAVKNAGGEASKTKLVAARNLGLPVLMLARPPQPDGAKVETVEDALTWVQEQMT